MAQRSINNHYQLLMIGGSAGSLDVLMQLLPELRADLDLAIVIILHRKSGESLLVELLSDKTAWPVKEAEEKEPVEKENIYVAPSDYHLLIEKDKTFSLDFSEKLHYSRPAIDISFETAADAYGPLMVALLLSGANADGAEGLRKIKTAGGLTIVQEPAEAIVSYMPEQAMQLFQPDYVADTREIISIINNLNR
jgi:two-component system, chemotaxis family, protein-glutamate methylesterase/glutaminase